MVLVVVGTIAIVLPGPGILIVIAGLALLAPQYRWANRALMRCKRFAVKMRRRARFARVSK